MTPALPEAKHDEHGPDRKGRKIAVLVLCTVGWLVLSVGLLAWAFLANFCLDPQACAEADQDAPDEWLIAFVVIPSALVLLAILPFLLKMPKTGAVYAILVVIIAVVLAQSGVAREIAADVLRDDRPAVEPEPRDPAQCLPRSGGDSECPGG